MACVDVYLLYITSIFIIHQLDIYHTENQLQCMEFCKVFPKVCIVLETIADCSLSIETITCSDLSRIIKILITCR